MKPVNHLLIQGPGCGNGGPGLFQVGEVNSLADKMGNLPVGVAMSWVEIVGKKCLDREKLAKNKSIIILSEKSSGSSSCQNLLAKFADIQHVQKTRHYQSETLYWTKAASVLELPQLKMVDSEVPLNRDKARHDLVELLQQNLGFSPQITPDKAWIMEGWRLLCEKYAPIFLEKSPHYLCQWSALQLITECMHTLSDVDFLLIGLVRNPMDTIYSQYTRWKSPPQRVEKQWCEAYNNLLKLKEMVGDKLVIIRYEDMVSSLKYMEPVFQFCDVVAESADSNYLHRKSLQKWKKDTHFGFVLSPESTQLAQQYGYQEDELSNDTFLLWPWVRAISRATYLATRPVAKVARNKLARLVKNRQD